jgi:hypothetical protein
MTLRVDHIADTNAKPADNKTVFSNVTERYALGKVARVPKIIGTAADEGSALTYVPLSNYTTGPNPAAVLEETLAFVCTSYNTSVMRQSAGLATYRYEWAGNFTNLAPVPWLGAYHYSDLYMLFGTYPIAPGVIPALEVQTSEKMQDLFLDFITSPGTFATDAAWPEYNPDAGNGGSLLRFGGDGKVREHAIFRGPSTIFRLEGSECREIMRNTNSNIPTEI